MINFFKKNSAVLPVSKTTYSYPLASVLNDHELIEYIGTLFSKNKPVVSALFLVAMENLPFRYANFHKAMLKSKKYPASMDGLVEFVLNTHAEHQGDTLHDEIESRRWFYFYAAALLTIAHERARKNPELWEGLAEIWSQLLAGAHALRSTIDQTSLWNAHEVFTFSEIQNGPDGEKFVVSVLLPKELRGHENFKQWLQRDLQQEFRDLFQLDGFFPDRVAESIA